MRPDLSIIIVNWNTRDLLSECIDSLTATISGIDYETWVVDNASTDGSIEMLQLKYPEVRIIQNSQNLGFAAANNQAIAQSEGEYLLLINSDAKATPEAVAALHKLAQREPQAGLVGAQLLNPDRSFQASYTPFPTLGQEFQILTGLGRRIHGSWYPSRGPQGSQIARIVDYVEGACMYVRRKAVDEVGGLDESYFMYAEEVDWCYRFTQAGWEVWYQPAARIIHHRGASSSGRQTRREADLYRSRVKFFWKNYGEGQAKLLISLIFAITALKIPVHKLAQWFSGEKRGREVIGFGDLISLLRES